jgi:hypothetical protein
VTRVVVVPGVLALLPEYAGIEDPVAELRTACLEAVGWLGADVRTFGDRQGSRVARHLLDATSRSGDEPSYLVVGNGSAKRTEKAPGHFDERAEAFDAELGAALRAGRAVREGSLARGLWASVGAFAVLAELGVPDEVQVDYDDAPYGVQYWVMRLSIEDRR